MRDMVCKDCGEDMYGDGYTIVLHCGQICVGDIIDIEPDAEPVYCGGVNERS